MNQFQNISLPGPTVTPVSKPFWDSIEKGRLSLQQCDQCNDWVFYPRAHCPHCFHPSLTWREASGHGTLKTWSVIHRAGNPAWQELAPYAVGIVELEEGPSMLSHLLINQSDLSYGMNVQLEIIDTYGTRLPCFTQRQEDAQ